VRTHTNLQFEYRPEIYETGMIPWDIEMMVEESLILNRVSVYFYFIFSFNIILFLSSLFFFTFDLQHQCRQIAHVLHSNPRFFCRDISIFRCLLLKKKPRKKHTFTSRLPYVSTRAVVWWIFHTCGCAVRHHSLARNSFSL
jgi:hypothetical protein